MQTEEDLYSDLLGKPFEMGGDGINGYDCYTLSRAVCKRGGVNLPMKQTQLLATVDEIEARSNAINIGKGEDYVRLEKPEPFCVVTFSIVPPYVTHMGLVLEDCISFIHIFKKRSVAIERLNHKLWESKIEGYFRYVGK